MTLSARLAVRRMLRSPITTIAVVVILALGIAATSALFTIVDEFYLEPLPFGHPWELATVAERMDPAHRLHADQLADEAARLDSSPLVAARCSAYLATTAESRNLADVGDVNHAEVSGAFFTVLQTAPLIGRVLGPSDVGTQPRPVVISQTLWSSRFGRDPTIVGGIQVLDGERVHIVGVMPLRFQFPRGADMWSITIPPPGLPVGYVRLSKGHTPSQLAAAFPRLDVHPIDNDARPSQAGALAVLLIGSILVLLIAWVQVAALQASHVMARRSEIATNYALGASRWRIATNFLIEAILISGLAVGLALPIVPALVSTLLHWLPAEMTVGHPAVVTGRTLVFVCAVAALGTVALSLMSYRLIDTLIGSAWLTSPSTPGATQARGALHELALIAQLSLTTVLSYLAVLALVSLGALQSVDLGIQPTGLLVISTPSTRALRTSASATTVGRAKGLPASEEGALGTPLRYEWLTESYAGLRAVRGVLDVAGGIVSPIEPGGFGGTAVVPARPQFVPITVRVNDVTRNFFSVLGVRLVSGRLFDPNRTDEVVVNETMARQLQASGSPVVGETIWVTAQHGTVVGVVADTLTRPDASALPEVFFRDRVGLSTRLFVRTDGTTASVGVLKQTVASIWGVVDVSATPMISYVDRADAPYRGRSTILTALDCLGLLLAAVGIVSALSYSVRLRLRDLAIRQALGAPQRAIIAMVLSWLVRPLMIGFGVGLFGAIMAARSVRAVFYGVSPIDWRVVFYATALVALLSVISAVQPAISAARVDPLSSLKEV